MLAWFVAQPCCRPWPPRVIFFYFKHFFYQFKSRSLSRNSWFPNKCNFKRSGLVKAASIWAPEKCTISRPNYKCYSGRLIQSASSSKHLQRTHKWIGLSVRGNFIFFLPLRISVTEKMRYKSHKIDCIRHFIPLCMHGYFCLKILR